jgi:enterochelin esterase-like enzyme
MSCALLSPHSPRSPLRTSRFELPTFLAAVAIVVASTFAPAQSLTARTVRFESATLGGQATFAILVPPGYDSSTKRYPVVYLLHGGTQNHTAFPARSWFAKEVSRRELIVVMPHVPQITYTMRGPGGSTAFEEFIVKDLVAYVDATYRTNTAREARAIGGLSMGGFGAVMTGLKHPELFAAVGAFSGAFSSGREALLAAAVSALPVDAAPYFYLACGIEDAVLPAGRELVRLLASREIPHEYREVPGGHSWDVWDPQTLAFLDTVTHRPGFAARP